MQVQGSNGSFVQHTNFFSKILNKLINTIYCSIQQGILDQGRGDRGSTGTGGCRDVGCRVQNARCSTYACRRAR